ncbi:MAG: GNAT family N-acetyltransferase [Jatrophihabitantaceae bacterium]
MAAAGPVNAAGGAGRRSRAGVFYREPGRSYLSSLVLLLVLGAGFAADVALGGGRAHLAGWIVAVVLVVGVDLLVTYAARSTRSLTITADELRVGEASLVRDRIVGFELDLDRSLPVLGRSIAEGLPRGASGLALHLVGGAVLLVPTRHPDRVAAALEVALERLDIRVAEPQDLPLLAEIDSRAESLFRVAGLELPPIPFPVDEMHEALVVFVAGRPPVGFVRVDEVDGLAHVEELAVVPGRMRQGLGTGLLEAGCAWAAEHGYPAITLITYADVPWNAPFYAARGFHEVREHTPEIVELRDWERAVGLDGLGYRIVMRRELP